jgi:hypothetical protein
MSIMEHFEESRRAYQLGTWRTEGWEAKFYIEPGEGWKLEFDTPLGRGATTASTGECLADLLEEGELEESFSTVEVAKLRRMIREEYKSTMYCLDYSALLRLELTEFYRRLVSGVHAMSC